MSAKLLLDWKGFDLVSIWMRSHANISAVDLACVLQQSVAWICLEQQEVMWADPVDVPHCMSDWIKFLNIFLQAANPTLLTTTVKLEKEWDQSASELQNHFKIQNGSASLGVLVRHVRVALCVCLWSATQPMTPRASGSGHPSHFIWGRCWFLDWFLWLNKGVSHLWNLLFFEELPFGVTHMCTLASFFRPSGAKIWINQLGRAIEIKIGRSSSPHDKGFASNQNAWLSGSLHLSSSITMHAKTSKRKQPNLVLVLVFDYRFAPTNTTRSRDPKINTHMMNK